MLDEQRNADLFGLLIRFHVADRADGRATKRFIRARDAANAELDGRGEFEVDACGETWAFLFLPPGSKSVDAGIPYELLPCDHYAREVAERHDLQRLARREAEAALLRKHTLEQLERHRGAADPKLLLKRAKTLLKELDDGPARDRMAAALPGIRALARAEIYG